MKTTGIFETHIKHVRMKGQNTPIHIVPFGDVHWGHPMFSMDTWKRFVTTYKDRDDVLFFGMGDYQDFMSSSERRAMAQASAQLHEGSVELIDQLMQDRMDQFTNQIRWMGDRLIGLIEGNHYFGFQDGRTSTMKMAEELKTKYLGVSALIRLALSLNTSNTTIDIWAHHGRAGGQLAGSPFNTIEKMQLGMRADIYVMGHDHSIGTLPKAMMEPRLNIKTGEVEIHERRIALVRSGSFLRGYVKGKQSYIADAGLNPKPLGWVDIEAFVRRPRDEEGARSIEVELRGAA